MGDLKNQFLNISSEGLAESIGQNRNKQTTMNWNCKQPIRWQIFHTGLFLTLVTLVSTKRRSFGPKLCYFELFCVKIHQFSISRNFLEGVHIRFLLFSAPFYKNKNATSRAIVKKLCINSCLFRLLFKMFVMGLFLAIAHCCWLGCGVFFPR